MLDLPTSAGGFRAAFSLSFEAIPESLSGLSIPALVGIPTIVPVSSDYFEADVSVEMDATEAADSFTLCVYGLGEEIYDLLVQERTVVHITLGYDDGQSAQVMTGLLTEKSMKAGDQWYEATLKGVDFVFDRLQRPKALVSENYQQMSVKAVADAICQRVGVDTLIPDPGQTIDTVSFTDRTPLSALGQLAAKAGFGLQAKDGKLWMGKPDSLGVVQTRPIDDGATSRPVATRGAIASASPMDGQDFDIAGIPALRPNDRVVLGATQFRIESITHKFTRYGGYTCCGRALSPDATADDAHKAGRPSASLVARQLAQSLRGRERSRAAIDFGDVDSYAAGKATAIFRLGFDTTPGMTSPSIEATLRDKSVPLNDKPIASPFAFGQCGLVVPVYPGMRSMLMHCWNEPEDAVAAGFVWTRQMTPPPSEDGDWWLCLPTDFDSDDMPTGSAVNDLTTQDGQRVIEVAGMTINIGSGLLSDVGSRPEPGSDEALTIQSDDGDTKVTFENGRITLTDGTATVTVGGTKGQIEMTDGTVKLTIANGKVSIGS